MKRDRTLWAFGAICLLLSVSYGSLAWAGFVFDDFPLVVNNTMIRDLGNLGLFFRTDLWAGADVEVASGYYRPLVITSLAVDYALFGDWAGGYHLQSLFWHLCGCVLLLALLRRWVHPLAALVGAALFALHPLQSEAVAWIAARNDVMVAAFALGSLLALEGERPSPWRLALGGSLGLCALLSKESAVLLPLMVLGADLAFHRRFSHWSKWVALGGAAAVYLLLRSQAELSLEAGPDRALILAAIQSAPRIAGHYGLRVLSPYPLSVGATLEYLRPWVSISSIAVLGVSGLLLWRGGRKAAYGLGWMLLFFAPAVLAISFRAQLGERYMYLPLAGLGVALAAVLPQDRRLWLAVGALVLLHLAIVPMRLLDWRDNEALWGAAVRSDPNGYSYAGLAHVYNHQGRVDEAAHYFHAALEEEPPYTEFCNNAVSLGLNNGRLDIAYRGAFLVGQNCPDSIENLGLVATARLMAGDIAGADSALDRWGGSEPDERLELAAAARALMEGEAARYDALVGANPQDPAFADKAQELASMAEDNRDQDAYRAQLRGEPTPGVP